MYRLHEINITEPFPSCHVPHSPSIKHIINTCSPPSEIDKATGATQEYGKCRGEQLP
jgi:hypothetical protein